MRCSIDEAQHEREWHTAWGEDSRGGSRDVVLPCQLEGLHLLYSLLSDANVSDDLDELAYDTKIFFFLSPFSFAMFRFSSLSSGKTWFWVDIPVYFCHEHDWAAMKTQSGVILTVVCVPKRMGGFFLDWIWVPGLACAFRLS